MNIEADPLGYKQMSRQLAGIRDADEELTARIAGLAPWLRAATIAIVAIAIGFGFVLLGIAKYVMIPATAGIVVGLILGPIGDRGRAIGIPAFITYTLLVAAFCGILTLVAVMLLPVGQIVAEALPRANARLGSVIDTVKGWTDTVNSLRISLGGDVPIAGAAKGGNDASTVEIATTAVSIVTPALSQLVIFLFTLILFLSSRNSIRTTSAMMFGTREKRLKALRIFGGIENRLTDYFLVMTAINLGLGALVATVFLALDVPGAVSWGLVAFMLNYLPVVGPLMVKGALLAFGVLVHPTMLDALLPFLVFLTISMIEANLVTPRIVGTRITMNPLLIFLSVIFWTWMWGFPGAFLAMPLLAITSAVISARDDEKSKLPA
jgi:predicted PurR-regulated permease PerM